MLNKVLDRILSHPYLFGIFSLALIGIIAFLFLPVQKKKQPEFYLAFLFLLIVSFYELMAIYLVESQELNKKIHELISDSDFMGYNIWVFNIFNYQLSKIPLILWINRFINNVNYRKINLSLLGIFIFTAQVLTLTKIQEISGFQPLNYLMSYILGIVACGLFFVDLISSEKSLEIHPLRFIPFWFITLTLFQQVIVFLAEMSNDYLAFNDITLYYFFNYISMTLYVLMLTAIVVLIINQGLFIEKKAKTA